MNVLPSNEVRTFCSASILIFPSARLMLSPRGIKGNNQTPFLILVAFPSLKVSYANISVPLKRKRNSLWHSTLPLVFTCFKGSLFIRNTNVWPFEPHYTGMNIACQAFRLTDNYTDPGEGTSTALTFWLVV